MSCVNNRKSRAESERAHVDQITQRVEMTSPSFWHSASLESASVYARVTGISTSLFVSDTVIRIDLLDDFLLKVAYLLVPMLCVDSCWSSTSSPGSRSGTDASKSASSPTPTPTSMLERT